MKRTTGDLRVWHVPQVPMDAFTVEVSSICEGVKVMEILAEYDSFQFEHNVKPDYCNVSGLQMWVEDDGNGVPGWVDWYDEETGIDDPVEFIEESSNTTKCEV